MLNVAHKIKINSDVWSSTEHSRLLSLNVRASLDVPVNECEIIFTHPEGVKVKSEDEIEVELGYGDALELVFTGKVDRVDWSIGKLVIAARGSFKSLVEAHYNIYFDRPKASDIVKELSKEAEVKTDSVDTGLSFDYYAVGTERSAFSHLKKLSHQCGVWLYANEKDQLVFTDSNGGGGGLLGAATDLLGGGHEFQFGINILELSVDVPDTNLDGVTVFGESPASQGQGADASSWLTKKVVKGTAGKSNGTVRYVVDATARTQQNAEQIAKAYFNIWKDKKEGQLKTLGAAEIKLGSSLKISKMPLNDQNGEYLVAGINHQIAPRKGFVSKFTIIEK